MNKKIQQLLKLNDTQFNILELLFDKKDQGFSIKEIEEKINKDRTTIQKILLILIKSDYIQKKQMNLNRGYCFIYKINTEFKSNMLTLIQKKIMALRKLREEMTSK